MHGWNAFKTCGPFTKSKEKYKNLKRQKIHNVLTKIN